MLSPDEEELTQEIAVRRSKVNMTKLAITISRILQIKHVEATPRAVYAILQVVDGEVDEYVREHA